MPLPIDHPRKDIMISCATKGLAGEVANKHCQAELCFWSQDMVYETKVPASTRLRPGAVRRNVQSCVKLSFVVFSTALADHSEEVRLRASDALS